MAAPLIVWQLTDGKRGHERQTEGLVAALAARSALDLHRIAVPAAPSARLLDYLLARTHVPPGTPAPDLVVGAGRACQWPLLAARRAHGARIVYLMRPALPVVWFDLCIVPRHDQLPPQTNVIVSEGPLNPLQVHSSAHLSGQSSDNRSVVRDVGLLLIGGPSHHHGWDDGAVLHQIETIVAARPDLDWTLTDSRRTPVTFATLARSHSCFRYVAHRDCADDWLPGMLARTAQAWVSADSVNMLYEALTAGAEVGVIDVPIRRADRITAIADELCQRGWIRRITDVGQPTKRAAGTLREADRCAELLLARWPDLLRTSAL